MIYAGWVLKARIRMVKERVRSFQKIRMDLFRLQGLSLRFTPEENTTTGRNRKGNRTPPAAAGRDVFSLAAQLGGTGENGCIKDMGCLAKSLRLNSGSSDTFSGARENHGNPGPSFECQEAKTMAVCCYLNIVFSLFVC